MYVGTPEDGSIRSWMGEVLTPLSNVIVIRYFATPSSTQEPGPWQNAVKLAANHVLAEPGDVLDEI